jgi:hypothetical protein
MATGILNIRRNKAGKMLIKSANEVIGGLSAPSKMPGAAFSLSILVCHIGSLLRKVVGSTCYKCYAARGNYARATVKRAVKEHLELIAEIARQTPWCDHWLPTKELGRVIKWLDQGHKLPDNLCIRVSGYMIDEIPKGLPKGINSASVHSDRDRGKKNDCPAVRFHTTCDGANCRKCWDRKVKNVSYGMHGANATVGDSDAARSLWEKELQAGGVAV